MKIGVLFGGNSAERKVSLSSGNAISVACEELGHDVLNLDLQNDIKSLTVKESLSCPQI